MRKVSSERKFSNSYFLTMFIFFENSIFLSVWNLESSLKLERQNLKCVRLKMAL